MLVGAQGTGKSLALQWLKAALDGRQIVDSLEAAGSVAEAALTKDYRAHLLAFESDGKVRSTDISVLDPSSEDDRVAGWGGLTEFSSRFGDAVRAAVNESEP
ncbi:MAG: hypothetical protein HY791_16505 [Deltaproteobacteria bacterium]|nr:hypothetical protein [Deltaproteobacteria bacterium]